MKKILIKKNIFAVTALAAITFILSSSYLFLGYKEKSATPYVEAAICDTTGNLDGWIDTENLGPVFINTQSWNAENPSNTSSVNFGVEYNRQTGNWSGRGWNSLVGWVDFSYDQVNKIAQFVIPASNPGTWGNWKGEIILSAVSYSPQSGSFSGVGIDQHLDTGGVDDLITDDYIGSGEWTFDNLSFTGSTCPENVNLFLNGTPFLHNEACPILKNDINIQWTSENVVDGSCTAVGDWNITTSQNQYTGVAIHPNTDINQTELFKLECIGEYSGSLVEGVAIASCGTALPAGCDAAEDCPLEIIKPVPIEV